jgi:glutamate carboxypeptidase
VNGAALRAAATLRYPAFLARLSELVALDRGSRYLPGLRAAVTLIHGYAEEAGLGAERVPVTDVDGAALGEAVVARVRGCGAQRILLAAHLDTVFAPGTAQDRPLTVDGALRRAYGPGVCDDTAGLLAGLAAIETLSLLGAREYAEIVFVATPDEEIGSPGSRTLLAELAAEADAILCLECARGNGDLVSARAGVADVEIDLHGRAAHAGIEPERGANAALAAARLTVALQDLPGVNVGILKAGTRPNVVADRAHLAVDVRAACPDDYDNVMAHIQKLAHMSYVDGVVAQTRVVAPTPPWTGGPGTSRLLERARQVGHDLGLTVTDAATSGCADANLLAASGRAVLDGLGPVGGGDHGPDEWLDLDSVVPRVALLAGLIHAVGQEAVAP